MIILDLRDLINWLNDEINNGNRIKASKLYRIFCKYAKLQYPGAGEDRLKNYNNYHWR